MLFEVSCNGFTVFLWKTKQDNVKIQQAIHLFFPHPMGCANFLVSLKGESDNGLVVGYEIIDACILGFLEQRNRQFCLVIAINDLPQGMNKHGLHHLYGCGLLVILF